MINNTGANVTIEARNGDDFITKQNSDLDSARQSSSSQLSTEDYWFMADDSVADELGEIMTRDCAVNLQSEFEFFNQSPGMKLAIKSSLELNRRRK